VLDFYWAEADQTDFHQLSLANPSNLAIILSGFDMIVPPGLGACSQLAAQLNAEISELSSPFSNVGAGTALESLSG